MSSPNTRFWFDECVTPELEGEAHKLGFDATSNRSRRLLKAKDPEVFEAVITEDRVLVTDNSRDFKRLAMAVAVHPGLIEISVHGLDEQLEAFSRVVAFAESESRRCNESLADWFVCRYVYVEDDLAIQYSWLYSST